MPFKRKKIESKIEKNNKRAAADAAAIGAALADLGHVAGDQAKLAGERAQILASEGIDWAAPRVQKAWDETVRVSADVADRSKSVATEVAGRGRHAASDTRKKMEKDYIPRLQRALHDAAEAAKTDKPLSDRAREVGKVTQVALTEPTPVKKSKNTGNVLGWIVVGTVAAGAGYLLWRRTQPVDDPWAEEYWDDTTVTSPAAPADAPVVATAPVVAEESVLDEADAAAELPVDDAPVIGDVTPDEGRKLGEI